MARRRQTSEKRRTAGRVPKARWRATIALGMHGASSSDGPMGDNVAAAAAPLSSPEATIDAERGAKKRVGDTMVIKGKMAGGVGGAMEKAAKGEVDSAIEEGVGDVMNDDAIEEGVGDELEDVMKERSGDVMGHETEEEEVYDEMEYEAKDGMGGMMGDETEEEVDGEIGGTIGGRVEDEDDDDDNDDDGGLHTQSENQAQREHDGS